MAAADSPDDCSPGSPTDVAEVISGQISITDAPALPTSREHRELHALLPGMECHEEGLPAAD